MKTTAAVLRGGHDPFSVEELDVDEPHDDEVLVRMVAAGMCHTDLLSRDLPAEFFGGAQVYGHEGAGVVEAVGSAVSHVAAGDHVVLSFTQCGSCPACDAGRLPYCFNFQAHNMAGGRTDGSAAFTDASGERVGSHFFGQSSFAGHSIVAAKSAVKVDSSYDLRKLGPLGCGFQTGVGTVFNTLDVQSGQSIVVAGAGALGLSAIMAAKHRGASQIIAIDRHESRLELATQYGATETLSGAPAEIAPRIMAITSTGSDFAFDTTGNADVVKAIIGGLNNIGTAALAGVGFGELVIDQISMISGRTITGTMEGDADPSTFIPMMAKLMADGALPLDELITEFAIADVNAAEAASADGSVIKPVLIF